MDEQAIIQEFQDVHEKLRSERGKKRVWMSLTVLLLPAILAAILYNTKDDSHWEPDLDDDGGVVYWDIDWWGLSRHRYDLVWRHDSDASPGDPKHWCVRYPDGTWHMFIWRVESEQPVLFFPPSK